MNDFLLVAFRKTRPYLCFCLLCTSVWKQDQYDTILHSHLQICSLTRTEKDRVTRWKFLKAFFLLYWLYGFLLASLKTLTDSEYCSERCIRISGPAFRVSHCTSFLCLSLVDFLQCTCHGRLSEQFSGSQAAFGTTFRVTGGYRKARTTFLKRVTWIIFTSSKLFYRSKRKLYLDFLDKKAVKNFENL